MKTTFGEIESGTRFHYNIDADGHEPYLYKLGTEAFVEHGSGQGSRETISPKTEVWTWSEPVELHAAPTEIERAALTILTRSGTTARADHPGLRAYILALANDPNEARDLDDYIWETTITTWDEREIPLHEAVRNDGYVCWERQWDHNHSAFGAILGHKTHGRPPATRSERHMALLDDAAARLADAIANYRTAGRPSGDQTHTMGMGAPLLQVTTSVAAAVAEYHEAMLNLYAGEQMDLLALLKDAIPNDLISQAEAAVLSNVTPQAVNNAIRDGRLQAYAEPDAISHRPGDRRVSRADVEKLWLS